MKEEMLDNANLEVYIKDRGEIRKESINSIEEFDQMGLARKTEISIDGIKFERVKSFRASLREYFSKDRSSQDVLQYNPTDSENSTQILYEGHKEDINSRVEQNDEGLSEFKTVLKEQTKTFQELHILIPEILSTGKDQNNQIIKEVISEIINKQTSSLSELVNELGKVLQKEGVEIIAKKELNEFIEPYRNKLNQEIDNVNTVINKIKTIEKNNFDEFQLIVEEYSDLAKNNIDQQQKKLLEQINLIENKIQIQGSKEKINKQLLDLVDEESQELLSKIKKYRIGDIEVIMQQLSEYKEENTLLRKSIAEKDKQIFLMKDEKGEFNPIIYEEKLKKAELYYDIKSELQQMEIALKEKDLEIRKYKDLSKIKINELNNIERFDEVQRENDTLRKQIKSNEDAISQLQNYRNRYDQIKKQHEVAVKIINDNKDKLESLVIYEQHYKETRKQNDELTRTLQSKEIELGKLNLQMIEMQNNLLKGNEYYNSEHETLLFNRRKEFESKIKSELENKYLSELSNKEAQLNENNRSIERLTNINQNLLAQLKSEEISNNEYFEKIEEYRNRLLESENFKDKCLLLENELTEERKKRSEVSEELAKANSQLSYLKKSIEIEETSLQKLKDTIEEKQIEKFALLGEIKVKSIELEKINKSVFEKQKHLSTIFNIPLISNLDKLEKKLEIDEKKWLTNIIHKINEKKFDIPEKLLKVFHTSLKTQDMSPLTMLVGISGTGKSELPKLYADYGGITFLNVSVQPNWDSPSDLFGFYNYTEEVFNATELSKYLSLFASPIGDKFLDTPGLFNDNLLMVLLDEMNLARVEYYFSELLSKLEIRRGINRDAAELSKLRASISLEVMMNKHLNLFVDKNIFFVGTLNQDESTFEVSDKVIDRANVITFPRPKNFADGLKINSSQDFVLSRSCWNKWCEINKSDKAYVDLRETLNNDMGKLNNILSKINKGIGHRVFQSILSFIYLYPLGNSNNENNSLQDSIISKYHEPLFFQYIMKILPKVKGVDVTTQMGERVINEIQNHLINLFPEQNEYIENQFSNSMRNDIFEWQGDSEIFL